MSEEGSFYTSGEINKRMKDTVDLAECVIEIKAQIDRFEQITGKTGLCRWSCYPVAYIFPGSKGSC